jgi:glycosyltransferase involved in cell wall biosynthesis
MRVSIIIPIYNRLYSTIKLINKLHGQIEGQKKLDQVQVICINDGSTEETECEPAISELCKIYGFEYYKQKNIGGAATCNKGISKVKGDYFTFIDCDDDITDDYIQNIFSELGDNEHLIAYKWYFKEPRVLGEWHDRPYVNWNVWSYLFRTDYFSKFRFGENINVGWDYDFVHRSIGSDPSIYIRYTPNKALIIYNDKNPQSITNKFHRGEIKVRKDGK